MEVTINVAKDDLESALVKVIARLWHIQMERDYFEQFTGDEPDLLKLPPLEDDSPIFRTAFGPRPYNGTAIFPPV